MKTLVVTSILVGAITIAAVHHYGGGTPAYAQPVGGEELSLYMGHMQRLNHKLGLSIDAKNQPLADFYRVEIGQMVDVIKLKFPEYGGFQVATLIGAMLTPYLAPLEKAINDGDWAAASSAYDNLIASGCNGCHTATQRAFVKIERNKNNPFNQNFAP